MKKDIEKPAVEGVTIAIKLDNSKVDNYWTVHLINSNDYELENIIVASKGYNKKGEKVEETSILRHKFDKIKANSTQQIEVITEEVFHLFPKIRNHICNLLICSRLDLTGFTQLSDPKMAIT